MSKNATLTSFSEPILISRSVFSLTAYPHQPGACELRNSPQSQFSSISPNFESTDHKDGFVGDFFVRYGSISEMFIYGNLEFGRDRNSLTAPTSSLTSFENARVRDFSLGFGSCPAGCNHIKKPSFEKIDFFKKHQKKR